MAIRTYGKYGDGSSVQYVALKELLDRAPAFERLDVACDKRTLTPGQGASINLRRYVNPSVNDSGESEGVTPTSRALTHEDFVGTLSRYSEVFECSRYEYDLSPYDAVMGARGVLQDLILRTRERIRWNAAVAGTSVAYAAAAGTPTARTDVDDVVTLGQLQVAIRQIAAAKGVQFTDLDNGNGNSNTTPVEAGFFCFTHTDMEPDIRKLSGFKPKSEFGDPAAYPPGTFGAVQNIVFVTSPEALVYADAGAAVSTTGMISTTGSSIDVYPLLIVAKGALTSIALSGKGRGGFGNASIKVLDQADKSDPTNTRVQVTASWYDLCLITSNDWLYRIESACTADPA